MSKTRTLVYLVVIGALLISGCIQQAPGIPIAGSKR